MSRRRSAARAASCADGSTRSPRGAVRSWRLSRLLRTRATAARRCLRRLRAPRPLRAALSPRRPRRLTLRGATSPSSRVACSRACAPSAQSLSRDAGARRKRKISQSPERNKEDLSLSLSLSRRRTVRLGSLRENRGKGRRGDSDVWKFTTRSRVRPGSTPRWRLRAPRPRRGWPRPTPRTTRAVARSSADIHCSTRAARTCRVAYCRSGGVVVVGREKERERERARETERERARACAGFFNASSAVRSRAQRHLQFVISVEFDRVVVDGSRA